MLGHADQVLQDVRGKHLLWELRAGNTRGTPSWLPHAGDFPNTGALLLSNQRLLDCHPQMAGLHSTAGPCCSPRKMAPINMLYLDQVADDMTVKYQ